MAWFDDAKRMPFMLVARQLGLEIGPDGRSCGPCPVCFRPRRSSEQREKAGQRERRLALSVSTSDHADYVKCFTNGTDGCGFQGSMLDLAAAKLFGVPKWEPKNAEQTARLRAFFGDAGFGVNELAPVKTPRPPPPPARRLQNSELDRFWSRSLVPVGANAAAVQWLSGKGIDPAAIDRLGLAKALPPEPVALPRFARCGGQTWFESGHHLVVQCFECCPDGDVKFVGCHSRAVNGNQDKARWPAGAQGAGLVLLWAPAAFADSAADAQLTMIVEGVPDFLLAAVMYGKDARIIGVFSGSATPDAASHFPPCSKILLAMHDDESGRKYADKWQQTLAGGEHHIRRDPLRNLVARSAIPATVHSASAAGSTHLWTSSTPGAGGDAPSASRRPIKTPPPGTPEHANQNRRPASLPESQSEQ